MCYNFMMLLSDTKHRITMREIWEWHYFEGVTNGINIGEAISPKLTASPLPTPMYLCENPPVSEIII